MSIADLLLKIVIFLLQKIVIPILPTSLPFFPIEDLNAILVSDLKNDLIYSFSGIGKIMPVNLILIFVLVMIGGEITLMLVKMGFFIVNLVRGSGA
jgi:hypothetical protein